jgi:hypothetical protein
MLEASVARDLDILYKSKKIRSVQAQVWFDLFGKNGTKIFRHRPDFLVTRNDGTQKVLEAKGEASDDWRIKKALFEDNYPPSEIRIHPTRKGIYRVGFHPGRGHIHHEVLYALFSQFTLITFERT